MLESLNQEKKVEYIELIYDLIFVYLIGRSASLLDRVEAGFISFSTFADYLASSLIFIQIWYYSTLYINRYGKNGISENIMLLTNMFLLYIMGANTNHGWDMNYPAFAGAWALILINMAVHYWLRLKEAQDDCFRFSIKQNIFFLLGQAFLVAISILIRESTGYTLAPWIMLLGFISSAFLKKIPVNFGHLTERVMLYVVFTFGEMIIIIAGYFTQGFNFQTMYFALLSFLIAAGLFFSYGFVYDHLLDRDGSKIANGYMLLHVFLITSLSCITTALEFMRESEIHSLPKTIMMIVSLLTFFASLAMTEHWSKRTFLRKCKFILILICEFALFTIGMLLSMENGYVSIALTVIFIYAQLATLFLFEKHTDERKQEPEVTMP